jgi:hypothetical protein
MRKYFRICLLIFLLLPAYSLFSQVTEKNVVGKELLNVSRDSLLQLIRIKDSVLLIKKHDSIIMASMIARLEFNRDSLNSSLNYAIYRQKVDSAERMRHYLNYRDFNRRTRADIYDPIGIIEDDSVRSSLKQLADVIFEDTAYVPKPLALKSTMERLVSHLTNDSIYFRIINAKQDTIPFILKKNKYDSTAFYVMNSSEDSAKLFVRNLDKHTLYMWVGDDLMLKHMLRKQGEPELISINWQDKNKSRIARRKDAVPPFRAWNKRAELNLILNQNMMINWAKGGNNNTSLTTDFKAWANYAKGNVRWDNHFWFIYGLQKTELLPLRKSNDKIYMASTLSHKAFKSFDYTLSSTFNTQSFKGYNLPTDTVPVSKIMAPADLAISLGLTYRPNPKLLINMSPVSGQFRFVLDTTLINAARWGIKPGKQMNALLGANVTIQYNTVLFKKVNMGQFLNLYNNYIIDPQKINFYWRMNLSLPINKFISMSIQTETVYDYRTVINLYEVKDGKKVKVGEGKRVQFNEIFGATFKYIF